MRTVQRRRAFLVARTSLNWIPVTSLSLVATLRQKPLQSCRPRQVAARMSVSSGFPGKPWCSPSRTYRRCNGSGWRLLVGPCSIFSPNPCLCPRASSSPRTNDCRVSLRRGLRRPDFLVLFSKKKGGSSPDSGRAGGVANAERTPGSCPVCGADTSLPVSRWGSRASFARLRPCAILAA